MHRLVPLWLWTILGLGAWCSGAALLALREHFVYQYVVHRDLPLAGGLPAATLLALAAVGAGLAAAAVTAEKRGQSPFVRSIRRAVPAKGAGPLFPGGRRALLWMASCAVVAALEQLRRLGVAIPTTFLEPLYFAFATTMAVWALRPAAETDSRLSLRESSDADSRRESSATFAERKATADRPRAAWNKPAFWRLCLTALVTLFVAWWFYQGEQAYGDYQLGYPDFAEYAHRVVNTWQGRGFLARPPNWPVFYDHFNPGLALLAPLWGLWPDARLVILIQAIALAAPAALVAGLARRFGAGPAGAVAWAAAYLVLPAVGQLNLSYSYGFHPVSLALVTVTAAIWAAFARRPWLALVLAIVSCSFEESVFVALAGISLALAAVEFQCAKTSPTGLPAWVWLAAAACFALGFVLVVRIAGLSKGTLQWRFANLGGSLTAAALSPVLRPKAFWGQVLRPESLYFVLALSVPAGALFVVRGWRALLGLAAPLVVLVSWSVDGSTCIALQYVTLLIPCLVLAALLGAASMAGGWHVPEPPAKGVAEGKRGEGPFAGTARRVLGTIGACPLFPAPENLMAAAGISVLAGGVVASIFFGALPVSRPTIPFTTTATDRAALRPRLTILDHAVELAARPAAAVLASCRLAAHLLNVRRLEALSFALPKVDALTDEARREDRRRWIEVFDTVAVDLKDRDWNHSLADLQRVVFETEAAGYQAVLAERGILVYQRPRSDGPLQDNVRRWRVSRAEAGRLAENAPAAMPAMRVPPGLRVLRLAVTPVVLPGAAAPSRPQANLEVVLQATRDWPPECCFRYTLADADGQIVADTGLRLTADGNRPSNWWRKGEAWRDRLTIDLPAGKTLAALRGQLEVIPLEPLLRAAAGRAN